MAFRDTGGASPDRPRAHAQEWAPKEMASDVATGETIPMARRDTVLLKLLVLTGSVLFCLLA